MSDQEVLRLVAEVVDKFSGPSKDLVKTLKEINTAAKISHNESAKAAREHSKHLKELHERFEKVGETALDLAIPALGAVGIAGLSAGEAIRSVVEASRHFGELGRTFSMVHQRSGLSVKSIREVDEVTAQVGLSVGQMNESLGGFGEFLDQTNKNMPEAMNRWREMPLLFQKWGKAIADAPRDQAFDRVLDMLPEMSDKAQRRQALRIMGLPEDFASFTKEELEEARRAAHEIVGRVPFDQSAAEKADAAWIKLGASARVFRTEFEGLVGDMSNGTITKLSDWLGDPETFKAFSESLRDEVRDAKALYDIAVKLYELGQKVWKGPDIPFLQQTPLDALKGLQKKLNDGNRPRSSPGYFHPTAFVEGAGDGFQGSGDAEKVISESVKTGVIAAFREWFLGQQTPGSSGGISNASFGGIGTSGASSGGLHSGGNYNLLPNDSTNPMGQAAAHAMGKQFTGKGNPFDRARFRAEIAADPSLRNKILRIAANEQGSNPLGTQAVLESMMNRASVRGTSLAAQARWYHGEHGYYAEGSMGRGALENSKSRAILENSLTNALANSNIIDYATDNSSGDLARREKVTGKFRHHRDIHGESFFAPGSSERYLARRYDALKAQADKVDGVAAHREAIRAHFGHRKRRISDGLIDQGRALGLDRHQVTGAASLRIDLNGFPKGTRTASTHEGLFKQVSLNRGRPMGFASEEA